MNENERNLTEILMKYDLKVIENMNKSNECE